MKSKLNDTDKCLFLIAIDNFDLQFSYLKYLVEYIGLYGDSVLLLTESAPISNLQFDIREKNIFYSKQVYDVEKWRDYILYNWHKLLRYEEVYFMNSSVFGPVCNLQDVFQEMRSRVCDFWGITEHNEIYIGNTNICKQFIQRYFFCIRKSMLTPELYEYFKELPQITALSDAEKYFEFKFTEDWHNKGYTSSVYCNTSDLDGYDKHYAVSHILINMDVLLKREKAPFVPKAVFELEKDIELEYREGAQSSKIINYIQKKSTYDINMIFEYLLKSQNVYDILTRQNMYFTINDTIIINEKMTFPMNEVLIIAYLFYIEEFKSRLEYLQKLRNEVNVIIITDSSEKSEVIQRYGYHKNQIIITEKRGREWGGLLVNCRSFISKFRYLCFIHDKKSDHLAYTSLGRSFQDLLWDNMIASKEYILNVINFFENHPNIGVLLPPIYHQGIYNDLYGDYWSGCYDETVFLAHKLGIDAGLIRRDKPPISIGGCFWCQTRSLQPLWDYSFAYKDFCEEPMPVDGTINHALERILPYIAQNQNFFSAIIFNKEYAQLYLSNLEYMMQYMLRQAKKNNNYLGTFHQMMENLEKENI